MPGAAGSPDIHALIPAWGGFDSFDAALPRGGVHQEDRSAEAHGWPLPALWSPRPATANLPWKPVVPLHPIWRGLLLDALCYAGALWALHWMLTRPRRFVLEVSRLKRGCCIACGYDLGFEFTRGCPECGWRRDARR
jgi:hypothetical protein